MNSREKEKLVHQTLIAEYDRFYRLAYSYVRNKEDAMDIVQEGAYKAILRSDSLKKREAVMTWIYRIMVNEALQLIRRRKRETFGDVVPEESVWDDYTDMDLEEAISHLSAVDQTIIRLRFFEDRKFDDIAEIIQFQTETVKSRLYRAMKQLRLELKEEG